MGQPVGCCPGRGGEAKVSVLGVEGFYMNTSNLKDARSLIGERPDSNCWGMTAFIMGWRKRLLYMKPEAMERELAKLRLLPCRPKRFRLGDVCAKFETWGGTIPGELLTHTAVYVGRGLWLHQVGYGCTVNLHKFSTMVRGYRGKSKFYRG